jgi:hypothetical protein
MRPLAPLLMVPTIDYLPPEPSDMTIRRGFLRRSYVAGSAHGRPVFVEKNERVYTVIVDSGQFRGHGRTAHRAGTTT